jgi:outer membrane protein assembly factor BamB
MKELLYTSKNIVAGTALLGLLTLVLWVSADSPLEFEMRVPGMDNAIISSANLGTREGPEGELILSDGVPSTLKEAWPSFRGNDLDNIYKGAFTPLPKGSELPEIWGLDVGEGFAGATILDGRVYMIDYDRENQQDAIRCLSFDDGKEIWRYTYPTVVKRNHGMSRTVPYVTDDLIVTIGPQCQVTCLDSKTGEKKWSLDLKFAYKTTVPPWYAGQCPLIDEGRLILAPGGTALLVAIDLETGEPIWESENPNGWKMTHSSVMPMMYNGQRTYLYCASGGITGVAAEDGAILWESNEWKINMANVPSPLVIDEDRIFLSGGYKAGSMMLQLEDTAEGIHPRILYRLDQRQFGSTQHTPIVYENHIFGVRPDGQLVCLDFDGNEKWASTPAYKFGLGPYMIAGSIIHVMDDDGLFTRVEATPDEFRLIDQQQVLHGHDAWAPIAYASGRMILRDLTRMVCIQVATN